jgi:hypothetical protein
MTGSRAQRLLFQSTARQPPWNMDSRLRGNDAEQDAASSFFSQLLANRRGTWIPACAGIQLLTAPSCITLAQGLAGGGGGGLSAV